MGLLDGDIAELFGEVFAPLYLDAHIRRNGPNTGESWDPVYDTPTDYPCKYQPDTFDSEETQGTVISNKDWIARVLVTSVEIEPTEADTFLLDGVEHEIVAVKTDTASSHFELQVRG